MELPDCLEQLKSIHKFEHLRDINKESIKFWTVIVQTGSRLKCCSNNTLMQKNEFAIDNTQTFSQELSTLAPLVEEEDISYDVKSLFNNILVKELIDHIINQIKANI